MCGSQRSISAWCQSDMVDQGSALIWCESATLLTADVWRSIEVPQAEFGKLQADDLVDIGLAFAQAG